MPITEESDFSVVPVTPSHIGGLAVLERLCFPNEPWSETSLSVLCQDHAIGYAVIEKDGTVSAYVGMQYAAGEGSITNVATHPAYRGKGRASALMSALLCFAEPLCPAGVYLEVRPTNRAALALYEKFGFVPVGRRKNFYRNPTEDALIMQVTWH